jgi:hypothetical protein
MPQMPAKKLRFHQASNHPVSEPGIAPGISILTDQKTGTVINPGMFRKLAGARLFRRLRGGGHFLCHLGLPGHLAHSQEAGGSRVFGDAATVLVCDKHVVANHGNALRMIQPGSQRRIDRRPIQAVFAN